MSLATRCTSCATVFRVVQDQLKVSEGWVRCGRCDTVFNALEHLFDLDRDGLPPNATTGEPTPHDSLPELPNDGAPRVALPSAFEALLRDRAAGAQPVPPAPAARPGEHPPQAEPEPDPMPPPIELLLDVPGGERAPAGEPAPALTHASIDAAAADDGTAPEFLRHAERSAKWQQPRVRRALIAACVLLAAGLMGQTVIHFRDGVAARAPGLRPLLAGWCAATGCTLEAPRRIADVTVENTGLVPAGAGAGSFQLSLTLRNRGAWAVTMPSVDLTLTDSNGQLVARRALGPQEFSVFDGSARRAAPAVLTPDSDTRLQTTLATSGRVVGYSVEVFYP